MRASSFILLALAVICGWKDSSGFAESTTPSQSLISKKGLQVQMIDDALALNIKHATLNVDLAALFDTENKPDSYPWEQDGKLFYFRKDAIDRIQVKPLSDHGVQVYLILLNHLSANQTVDQWMRPPETTTSAPNKLYGFNTFTEDGLRALRAASGILAKRFNGTNPSAGEVFGYIVGNEVNSHWEWYNIGDATVERVAEHYEKSVRIVNDAVQKYSPQSRVYISLEQHWTDLNGDKNPKHYCAGRSLLDAFQALAKAQGDFNWHVAFHPYPENLFQPRFWNDKKALPNFDSPKITFKNIEQLTAYLRQPDFLFNNQPRRVILSEQGFHTPDDSDGEAVQAAAYCYAWVKIQRTEGIDAFILHRQVDHAKEGGLKLGLWTRIPDSIDSPMKQKKIYEVFKAADTSEWPISFEFALPIIGIQRWSDIR
jgi:hypothetical protein